jgi:pyridoxamine 5'-phosphate oxidase family protein
MSMTVFTDAERAFLASQRIARLATADLDGTPDVSAVGFRLDGDVLVSGGLDLTKTIRYRHLQANPVATIVIDDLVSVDPWTPRGVKARGPAELTQRDGSWIIRISPKTIWSWGINERTEPRFGNIERRTIS